MSLPPPEAGVFAPVTENPLGILSSAGCWVTGDRVNEGLQFISCNCRHDIIISISARVAEKNKKMKRRTEGYFVCCYLICDLVKRTPHVSSPQSLVKATPFMETPKDKGDIVSGVYYQNRF